jgi:hypothetical protein
MSLSKKTTGTGLSAGRPSAQKQSLVDLMSDGNEKVMKRVSLDLDVETFKKLKIYALENGFKSTADVLRELIHQNIK